MRGLCPYFTYRHEPIAEPFWKSQSRRAPASVHAVPLAHHGAMSARGLRPSGLSPSRRAQPHGEGCSARRGAEPCRERPLGTPGHPQGCRCWALLPAASVLLDAEPDSPPLCLPHHQPQRPLETGERCSQLSQSLPTPPARSRGEPRAARARSSCPWPSPARPGPRVPRGSLPITHRPPPATPARLGK